MRVKAINSIGVSSTYVTQANYLVIGTSAPPSDVTDFSCNIIGKEAHLAWEQIPDLDLAYYQIRYSALLTGASWENSVSLVEKIARPATSISVGALKGTYLIKAFDKLGNFSDNATLVTTNIDAIGSFNAVATQTESPSFSGTKTNTEENNGVLTLTDITQEGTYDFASVIDLGAVYTSRVTASISQFSDNPNELFDDGRGFTDFDDATGLFDGTTPQSSNAHLEISLSDDNISYTDFKNFVIGDYTARYYKFRLVMSSRTGDTSPSISALSVAIDMEDRIISGDDITSGVTTYSVSFSKPFKSTTYAIGITAQNMNTGDYYTITNKTSSGFDILFKDSTNSNISRDFDYIAKGY